MIHACLVVEANLQFGFREVSPECSQERSTLEEWCTRVEHAVDCVRRAGCVTAHRDKHGGFSRQEWPTRQGQVACCIAPFGLGRLGDRDCPERRHFVAFVVVIGAVVENRNCDAGGADVLELPADIPADRNCDVHVSRRIWARHIAH